MYLTPSWHWLRQNDTSIITLAGRWFYLHEGDSTILRLREWVYLREGAPWIVRLFGWRLAGTGWRIKLFWV